MTWRRGALWLVASATLLLARPTAAGTTLTAETNDSPAPASALAAPLFALERARIEVVWTATGAEAGLHAQQVSLHHPLLRLLRAPAPPEPPSEEEPEKPEEPLPGSGEIAREALPFPLEVDQVALHDMEIVFLDETVPGREILRVHDLQILVENYSTRRSDSGGLPALITARGRIGRQGHVSLFATVNPWSDSLDFAGRAEMTGLRMEELGGFAEENLDLRPADGTLSAFVEFSVHDGRLSGGVKPILENVELVPDEPGFIEQLKAWLGEAVIELLSDDVAHRDAIAGVVPLEGRLRDPNVDVWQAISSVLGNAFIEAVSAGFANVPP